MGLSAVLAALAVTSLAPNTSLLVVVLVGLAGGVAGGLIAGLVNGWLIARLNVPPFIVTLGMFGIARGLAFLGSGGLPIPIRIQGFGQIGNGYLFYYHPAAGTSFFNLPSGLAGPQLREVTSFLPHPVTLIIVAVIMAHLLLSRTQFGLHVYAIGGNREAALRAGIPVQRRTIQIYKLSGLFAAVAGVLYITRFTSGAANAGEALLLDSIAAVVIGGASLFGGGGTIMGTVIGALIIAIIQNGLVILAVNPFWQFVAVGIVIILAVLIDQAKERVLKEKG
jgi:ribose transport system permease protein